MSRQVQDVPLKEQICSHCFPSCEDDTHEDMNCICDQDEQMDNYQFWLDLCKCYHLMHTHCVLLYMMTLITKFGTGLSLKEEDHGDFLYKNGKACRVNNKKVLIHIGYRVPHIIYTRYMIAKCCSRCTNFISNNCPMLFHHSDVHEKDAVYRREIYECLKKEYDYMRSIYSDSLEKCNIIKHKNNDTLNYVENVELQHENAKQALNTIQECYQKWNDRERPFYCSTKACNAAEHQDKLKQIVFLSDIDIAKKTFSDIQLAFSAAKQAFKDISNELHYAENECTALHHDIVIVEDKLCDM
jgi:hypothetical protein